MSKRRFPQGRTSIITLVLMVFCLSLFLGANCIQAEVEYSEWIGIYANNWAALFLWSLIHEDFPIIISMGEKVMVVKSVFDLPHRSIPTECPEYAIHRFKQCWFIKYD